MSSVKENNVGEVPHTSVENKIKRINRRELGNIFKKLESNAFPYDKQKRDELLHAVDIGNQLKTEDYIFISNTYKSHINELLPEIDRENENSWIISVTIVYIVIGIGLRIILNSQEQALMLFMGVLNILSIGLALFILSGNINKRVSSWIKMATLLDEDKRVLLSKYSKTKRAVIAFAWIFEIIIVIVELHLYVQGLLAIGNDVIAILAFGIALFNENVETCFVRMFEAKLAEAEL